jgi:serine/threonine-protein kinase
VQTPLFVDPEASVQRAQARVGQVLKGKWRLDALLGLGGLAAVYAAVHRNGKRVAVKMLQQEHSGDAETVTRFLQEGYAANAVGHQGAVSVIDDDTTDDGVPFLVMELLEGETLDARRERAGGRMELSEVLFVADQLLDVLAAAHDKGIVHRDIKPENLFLTKSGLLKVLDFGIARLRESRLKAKMTQTGHVMGTPAFMAPEQARAKWDLVDGRTDLWAVGASMFFLLTGKFVHQAQDGNELLILSATKPARSLGSVAPHVPRPVVALVDRALAFEREHRWPDARTMQTEVRRIRASLGGAMQQVPPAPESSGRFEAVPDAFRHDSGPQPADMAARMRERDERLAEIAKVEPAVQAARQRLAEMRARVMQAQAAVNAARAERTAHEQLFQRQAGARSAVVGAQRKQLRALLADVGRRAVEDTQSFGEEYNEARANIARLVRDADARAHAVQLHEAALKAYDAGAVMRGYVVVGAAAFVLFVLLPALLLALPWLVHSD